jgi:hypothetical protein
MKFQWIKDFMDAVGGRRFFLVCAAGAVDTGLLIAKLLPPEVYRDLTLATVGVYIGASTTQYVMAKKADAAAGA